MKLRQIKRRVNRGIIAEAQACYPRIMTIVHKGYPGAANPTRLTVFLQLVMLASQKRADRAAFLSWKTLIAKQVAARAKA